MPFSTTLLPVRDVDVHYDVMRNQYVVAMSGEEVRVDREDLVIHDCFADLSYGRGQAVGWDKRDAPTCTAIARHPGDITWVELASLKKLQAINDPLTPEPVGKPRTVRTCAYCGTIAAVRRDLGYRSCQGCGARETKRTIMKPTEQG